MKAVSVMSVAFIVGITGLNGYSTWLAREQSRYVLGELEKAHAEVRQCRERLTEVDCKAPLNPRLPFGGMGIWRAAYCPGSQP